MCSIQTGPALALLAWSAAVSIVISSSPQAHKDLSQMQTQTDFSVTVINTHFQMTPSIMMQIPSCAQEYITNECSVKCHRGIYKMLIYKKNNLYMVNFNYSELDLFRDFIIHIDSRKWLCLEKCCLNMFCSIHLFVCVARFLIKNVSFFTFLTQ